MAVRYIVSIIILISTFLSCYAQSLSDYKVLNIRKQVKDFPLDSINLASPLDYYISRAQVRLSGKFKNWQQISSSMFDYTANVPDETIDNDFRNYILNEIIDLS